MDDDSSLCQGCGAMLPLPDLSGLVTCPSCGRQKRVKPPTLGTPAPQPDPLDPGPAAAPDRLPDPPPMGDGGWPAPPVLAPGPGGQDWTIPPGGGPGYSGGASASGTSADRTVKVSGAKALGCGCLPGLVVLIVLGAIGFIVFRASDSVRESIDRATGGGSSDLMAISGTATVLGSGDGGSADLVAIVQDNSSSERTVTRFSLSSAGPKVRWTGPTTGGDTYDIEVAQLGSTLFVGAGDELWALDAGTGARRWSAPLSDVTTRGCADCFAVVDGTLVVRTQDAEVAGYREASGEPLWSRRLESPSGSVSVAGDLLIVSDDPVEPDQGGTTTVDPATGEVLRTVRLTCPGAPGGGGYDLVMGVGNAIRPVPGSTDVVGVFGSGDGCVVRWDPASGAVRYAARVEDISSVDAERVLLSGRDLVFGTYSEQLLHVDLASGRSARLTIGEDLSVDPLRIVGRTLLAGTTTTRGTAKGGLAAWDLETNEGRWDVRLPSGAQPVSPDSSDALFEGAPRSLVVPAGQGASLFTFDGTTRAVTVEALDLATGERTEVSRTEWPSRYSRSGTPSLEVEGVTPTRVVFSVDGLLQSMATSGEGAITTFPDLD